MKEKVSASSLKLIYRLRLLKKKELENIVIKLSSLDLIIGKYNRA